MNYKCIRPALFALSFLTVYVFSFFTLQLYGEDKKHTHTISASLSSNIRKGIEPNVLYFDGFYQFKNPYVQINTGLQCTSANTDLAFKALYTPLNFTHHRAGAALSYHISNMYNVGTEHDLNAAVEYTFRLPDIFMLYLQSGYLFKKLVIPVSGIKPIVTDHSTITMAFQFTLIAAKQWFIDFGMSSYETFRYPIFANPSINAGVTYKSNGKLLPKGMFAGLACSLRYSDMFTISGYPENFVVRSVWGIEF